MKLKTLKDFDDLGDIILNIKNLKAEAVKDFKKWEKHPNGSNVCEYIKWKNNLTEEDLKEGNSAPKSD